MITRIVAVAFATALVAAAPVRAADLAKVQAGHYVLDKSHAKVVFSINHLGFSTYYGFFPDLSGTLALDPAAPAKSALSVTINVAGMVTTDPKLDEKLKSETFFDTAKFPKATFKSTAIEVTGEGRGKLTGDLTLHGVTKPVTLDVTFGGVTQDPFSGADDIGFHATATVKRSDFGITGMVWENVVADEVKLTIEAMFQHKKD